MAALGPVLSQSEARRERGSSRSIHRNDSFERVLPFDEAEERKERGRKCQASSGEFGRRQQQQSAAAAFLIALLQSKKAPPGLRPLRPL